MTWRGQKGQKSLGWIRQVWGVQECERGVSRADQLTPWRACPVSTLMLCSRDGRSEQRDREGRRRAGEGGPRAQSGAEVAVSASHRSERRRPMCVLTVSRRNQAGIRRQCRADVLCKAPEAHRQRRKAGAGATKGRRESGRPRANWCGERMGKRKKKKRRGCHQATVLPQAALLVHNALPTDSHARAQRTHAARSRHPLTLAPPCSGVQRRAGRCIALS